MLDIHIGYLMSGVFIAVALVHSISRVTIGKNADHYIASVLIAFLMTLLFTRDMTYCAAATIAATAGHFLSVVIHRYYGGLKDQNKIALKL